LIRNHQLTKFVVPFQILNQAAEISVPRNNYRLIIVVVPNHCVQNQLCVHISLNNYLPPFFDLQCWFEDNNIPRFLQVLVEHLISGNVANEQEGLLNVVFILEINPETFKIKFPTLVPHTKIEVLTINEGIVVWFL